MLLRQGTVPVKVELKLCVGYCSGEGQQNAQEEAPRDARRACQPNRSSGRRAIPSTCCAVKNEQLLGSAGGTQGHLQHCTTAPTTTTTPTTT